jgi:hypothetical protein
MTLALSQMKTNPFPHDGWTEIAKSFKGYKEIPNPPSV